MLSKKAILSFVFIFCCQSILFAQKGNEKIRETSPLEQARSIKSKSPKKAIQLIESVIKTKRKKYDPEREAEAYMLLGNIYEEIDQKKLALQRYNHAATILENTKLDKLKAKNHLTIGQLSLKEGNTKIAKNEFKECLNYSGDQSITLKCEVGLANVAFQNKNFEESIILFNKITSTKKQQLDSLTISNLEARKSQAFVQMNDIPKAKELYFNSIQTFPYSVSDDNFYQPIENANRDILAGFDQIDDKIDLRLSNLKYKIRRNFSKQSIIKEQLELADLYLKKGEIEQAEQYIIASKDLTNNQSNIEQTAKVFKKAAEISQQRGFYDEADKNYQEFNIANEKANQGKQLELEKKIEILKDQAKIDILNKDLTIEEKQEQQLKNQKIIIALLSLLLLGSLISFYFIMRNVKAKRKANSLLLLKSLRTQMNPHFIFNALNSVNNYISKNDEKSANKFLANFSKLMRMVLDYSQKDFISFEEEIHLIELYLQLEHARFRDKFDYTFKNDKNLNFADLEIPPMLIQPFIENAVWHGLRYKKEKGNLFIAITQEDNHLKVTIIDDGIGREKSKSLKTKNQKAYKSTGLKNVDKRISLINDIYTKNYAIEIRDAFPNQEEVGTYVSVKIPEESNL